MKPWQNSGRLRPWRVLDRELVFECLPWLSLWRETVRLPDGREINNYYQVQERDYVVIAAWRDGKIFGLWRYKHGPRRVNLGLPAGYLEPGEDPLTAAQRELREEAGLASIDWLHLGSYYIDGNRSQAQAHLFVARNCRSVEAKPSDDLEEHIAEWLTPGQWADHVAAGSVATLGAAMAVQVGILDLRSK